MVQSEPLVFVKEHCFENDTFFILQDSDGVKRTIDGNPYKSFRFKPGMVVNAVVRNRGCAGEEITELLHPEYQTGSSYIMSVVWVKSLQINDITTHLVVVSDKYNNHFRIKVGDNSNFTPDQNIHCTLKEQKKGKLIFNVKEIGEL